MTKPSRVASFFSILQSAIAASAAVERGAKPKARDLSRLGIDAGQFDRIGR